METSVKDGQVWLDEFYILQMCEVREETFNDIREKVEKVLLKNNKHPQAMFIHYIPWWPKNESMPPLPWPKMRDRWRNREEELLGTVCRVGFKQIFEKKLYRKKARIVRKCMYEIMDHFGMEYCTSESCLTRHGTKVFSAYYLYIKNYLPFSLINIVMYYCDYDNMFLSSNDYSIANGFDFKLF